MKTLFLQGIFCLCSAFTLSALPVFNHLETDTTETEESKTVITIDIGNDDGFFGNNLRVGMLDFGISTYVDNDGSLDMPDELDYMDQVLWRSMNIGFHVVNLKLGLGRNQEEAKLGLTTGLKLNWTTYSMEKDYDLLKSQPTFEDAIVYDVPELKKNRLRGTYLQIPLLLEFNSKPKNHSQSINLGVGYVHQFLLGSNYKYKTNSRDKEKTRGDFNLRKSMGMIEGRIGMGHLNFYVQYGLDYLFQDKNGPEVTPINFGINIIPR